MSNTSFLSETAGKNGVIAVDRLSDMLHITRAELAIAVGLSRDAVTKTARVSTHATQARLRDIVEILNKPAAQSRML